MTPIGFIGLGNMGKPMVMGLLQAGFTVYVYDINPKAAESLVALGAILAASPKEMLAFTNIVITMVQTGQQVKSLCLREDGIFLQSAADLLYIDCSSIDIATTLLLHAEAEKRGIAMLDAPVSGGVAGASAHSLTIMAGGLPEHFERALPLLKAMGGKIVLAGAASHGQAAKICNNLLLGISMVGVSEAFCLAEKLGLDQKKFFDISSHSSGQCWAMTSYCPIPNLVDNVPSNRHYEPGFQAKMMLKDLRLSKEAAASVHAMTPLGTVATELYELYVSQQGGEKDFSAIVDIFSGKK